MAIQSALAAVFTHYGNKALLSRRFLSGSGKLAQKSSSEK